MYLWRKSDNVIRLGIQYIRTIAGQHKKSFSKQYHQDLNHTTYTSNTNHHHALLQSCAARLYRRSFGFHLLRRNIIRLHIARQEKSCLPSLLATDLKGPQRCFLRKRTMQRQRKSCRSLRFPRRRAILYQASIHCTCWWRSRWLAFAQRRRDGTRRERWSRELQHLHR
jgi:hypothetical protein